MGPQQTKSHSGRTPNLMAKNNLTDRVKNVGAKTAAAPAAAEKPAAPKPPPRAKPVKVTAELSPNTYRSLKEICNGLADDTGQTRVTNVAVIRALVEILPTDPDLLAKVRERVQP